MNKGVICKDCEFFSQTPRFYTYICVARTYFEMNFITGRRYLTGQRRCVDVNSKGDCQDYRQKVKK